jgi:BlaI family penicillinase repressor
MNTPRISDAEWDVMEVVWALGSATAREVIDRLEGSKDWHPRTVKTLLSRLAQKGALRTEPEGNRYRYYPRVARAEVVEAEGRSFVNRMFDGRAAPLLQYFAKRAKLSRREIDELRRILDEKARR